MNPAKKLLPFLAAATLFGACKKDTVAPTPTKEADVNATASIFEMSPITGSFTPNTASALVVGSNKKLSIIKVDPGNENAIMTFGNLDIIDGQSTFVPSGNESVGMKNVRVPNSIQVEFLSDHHKVVLSFDANSELYLGSQNPSDYTGANAKEKFEKNFETTAANYAGAKIVAQYK